mgnify:CR=1 FL=1
MLAATVALGAPARAQAPTFTQRPLPAPGVTSFTFQSPSMGVTYDVSACATNHAGNMNAVTPLRPRPSSPSSATGGA